MCNISPEELKKVSTVVKKKMPAEGILPCLCKLSSEFAMYPKTPCSLQIIILHKGKRDKLHKVEMDISFVLPSSRVLSAFFSYN